MSALLLSYPKNPHEVADDLESFLHVPTWEILHFHRTDLTQTDVAEKNTCMRHSKIGADVTPARRRRRPRSKRAILTFCGDWAGQSIVFNGAGCPGDCTTFVDENPSALLTLSGILLLSASTHNQQSPIFSVTSFPRECSGHIDIMEILTPLPVTAYENNCGNILVRSILSSWGRLPSLRG
ncbi:unnamed protein product [Somion occarium]|uniref:Uncharacterized protein n=1 Tax=Somion occarium TaxID=3059160 RepID=A0ABP1DEA2_9APHY